MTSLEFSVAGDRATAERVRNACRQASSAALVGTPAAVAVDPANTRNVADLLYGTPLATVTVLEQTAPYANQARRSIASGAEEIVVPLGAARGIGHIRSQIGTNVPLTLDVNNVDGLDLDAAEHAFGSGIDYVAFRPDFSDAAGLFDISRVLVLAAASGSSGVKLGVSWPYSDELQRLLLAPSWRAVAARSRLCLSVDDVLHPSL